MDQFPGLLARDFGLRPQGKAAPMAASKMSSGAFAAGSAARSGSGAGGPPLPDDLFGGGGGVFSSQQSNHRLHRDDVDIFGGGVAAPKYGSASDAFRSDPFFPNLQDRSAPAKPASSPAAAAGFSSSMPVYDKPVYDDDDDIFSRVPGMAKSSSASTTRHDDVFGAAPYDDDLLANLGGTRTGSRGSSENKRSGYDHAIPPRDDNLRATLGGLGDSKRSGSSSNRASPPYDDDLLANLGGGKGSRDNNRSGGAFVHSSPSYEDDLLAGLSGVSKRSSNEKGFEEQGVSNFDDLIPGFGRSSLPEQRRKPLENDYQQTSVSSKSTATGAEDPFVVLETSSTPTYSSSGLFTDIKPSGNLKPDVSSAKDGGIFDDINGFDGPMKSVPSFSFDMENNAKDRSPLETTGKEPAGASSSKASDNKSSYQASLGKSNRASESYKSVHRNVGPTINANANPYEASTKINISQRPEEHYGVADEIWLTVFEIPLFTQPTSAPPPLRPPPPPSFRNKPPCANMDESSSVGSSDRMKANEYSSWPPSYPFPRSHNDTSKISAVSSIDELENFVMGKPQLFADEAPPIEEEIETTSAAAASAAAMKEAMDRAEAKFKHAREMWERERDFKSSKNRETTQEVRDEDERERERLDHERELREREEKEKEQRRLEKMRELELEREREREKARQAVERANREARERAAAEARQKAERAARERAERVAVQRAQAEARERAAAEAKERAERLAAERERAEAEARERAAAEVRAARERAAREKAAAEAKEKAERAAVERAAAEVRARAQRAAVERAAAEARERAAAMARDKQQKNGNDLDSFFGMGARANSAPRERSNSYESAFDTQFENKGKPSGTQKTSSVSSSSMKRPSSTTNIMDDLTSVFGTSSSEEFQEIEGEPEERRRARLEREQRTRQRAAKALAEKNERELQMQREQAERDRVAESLNTEIKRWAAGKEGNLRALLSTLQYVLWPDSGWQPVSLTDLITGASVKKVYRKATLCVHPDKVRSGSVQQKYIAEKVFDILKEAWNKLNSEELF